MIGLVLYCIMLLQCFLGLFPVVFMSSSMTSIGPMLEFLQPLTLISQLRYFTDVYKGSFLKGAGFAELWPAALSMAAIGAVLYLIAG